MGEADKIVFAGVEPKLRVMSTRAIAHTRKLLAAGLLFAAVFSAAPLQAQKCTVSPAQVKLGGTLRIICPAEFTSAKLNDRPAKLYPETEGLHSTPEEMALLTSFREAISETRSWADPLAPPVSGCMTSPFGVKRLHNGKPTGEYHGGVDQRTPEGEPIRAVTAGVITFAQKF